MDRVLGRKIVTGVSWAAVLLAAALASARATAADSPVGKIVADVIVQGDIKRNPDDIKRVMNTKAGKPFSDTVAEEDVRRLIDNGWFPPNSISLYCTPLPDGRVNVILQGKAVPNRINEIVFRGNQHNSNDTLEKLTGLKKGMPMSPSTNETARTAILRQYQDDGRYYASVSLKEGNHIGDTRVVFEITEGPIVKVRHKQFNFIPPVSGEVTEQKLRWTVVNHDMSYLGWMNGNYNPQILQNDAATIQKYYQGLGFLSAKVELETIVSSDLREITAIYHIQEGRRYAVNSIKVNGTQVKTEAELLQYTTTRPGEPVIEAILKGDTERIKKAYGQEGYNTIVQTSLTEKADGLVDVHLQVDERGPQRVGNILIEGNERTRDDVIRRQLGLYPGQLLSYPELLQAERNLSRLGIFKEDPATGVKPTVTVDNPMDDTPYKDIRVHVTETTTGSFMVGAGVNSDAGLTGSVVINERNFDILRFPTSWEELVSGNAFRGAGQEFSINAMPGTTFQRYSATWRDPAFVDSRYSLSASVYYFQRGYNEYTEDRLGTRITLGRRLSDEWTLNLSTRAEQVREYDIPLGAPPAITDDIGTHFLVGESVGLLYNNTNSVIRPTEGMTAEAKFEEVFGSYQFPGVTAEVNKYFTTYQGIDGSNKQVLAFRSQAAWVGDDAPVFERLYAGGFRSMRGFAFRGVGPWEDGFNIGGNFSFLNTVEYQVPVLANDSVYLVAFCDHGTVNTDISLANYRVTVGGGVRISVPQLLGPVPLALDFGVPLRSGQEDHKQLVSFWLGFFN